MASRVDEASFVGGGGDDTWSREAGASASCSIGPVDCYSSPAMQPALGGCRHMESSYETPRRSHAAAAATAAPSTLAMLPTAMSVAALPAAASDRLERSVQFLLQNSNSGAMLGCNTQFEGEPISASRWREDARVRQAHWCCKRCNVVMSNVDERCSSCHSTRESMTPYAGLPWVVN